MEESSWFYCFRGFIVIPNQKSIYNLGLEDNSETKNKIFREFFSDMERNKKIESNYQNRVYLLIYKNKYDGIIHCQLARKTQINKRQLIENNIVEVEDNDYPYVNVFISLKSQKFLIESDTKVYENYDTCKKVIQNIINNVIRRNDVKIVLESVIQQETFWECIENNEIYNIEFKLNAPNIFDSETAARDIAKEAHEKVGADLLSLRLSNSQGKLKIEKEVFDSYAQYTCDGGGDWKITRKGKNGKKEKISSKQKSKKYEIKISYEKMKKDILSEIELQQIKRCFDIFETIRHLKENDS